MTTALWSRVDADKFEIVEPFLDNYPVKVGELAQSLGIDVVRAVLEPRISGLIQPSASSQSGFEIKVNKFEVKERQRFTVAHEIAHYLLHRSDIGTGVVDSILYRSALTSRKEVEANQLAAAIVMPRVAVQSELAKLGHISVDEAADKLAAIFGVSTPAMRVRLGIA